MKRRIAMTAKKVIRVLVSAALAVLMLCSCGQTKIEKSAVDTANYLQNTVKKPVNGSVGGEWVVIGLAGSGVKVPEEYFEGYYEELCGRIIETGGVLDERKYTEFSRVILALGAIGKDPADVMGFDLFKPLGDYDRTLLQGINGAIWALIALNFCDCEPPENPNGVQGSREAYLAGVLDAQNDQGGWGLIKGSSDVDITAMALQALAAFKDRADVSAAVEKGLSWLSAQQLPDGGFYSYESESLESVAQTIIALYELGLNVEDERFVKNGNSLYDALMRFSNEDGGFCHNIGGGTDEMATEQAFLAVAEMLRAERGESALFRMKKQM